MDEDFDSDWTFCVTDWNYVVGVKGKKSVYLRGISMKRGEMGRLNTARLWPGLAWVGPFLYVFGGNTSPALTSCEKLHFERAVYTKIGNMKGGKACFTPCVGSKEVYLCCGEVSGRPFEAFNIETEAFRDLNVTYRSHFWGSVSFILKDCLYLVTREEVILKWKVERQKLIPVKGSEVRVEQMYAVAFH